MARRLHWLVQNDKIGCTAGSAHGVRTKLAEHAGKSALAQHRSHEGGADRATNTQPSSVRCNQHSTRPSFGDILAAKMAEASAAAAAGAPANHASTTGTTANGTTSSNEWPNNKDDYDLGEVIGTFASPFVYIRRVRYLIAG